MATILTIAQNAAKECGFDSPSSLVSSTDPTAVQLLALLNREGRALQRKANWTTLTYETTAETSSSQAAYALPGDFSRSVNTTQWNRGQHWPIWGPINAQHWQLLKSGIISTYPLQRYRIRGNTSTTLMIDPVPTTAESLVYEYISKGWCTARAWVTGTVYAASATVSNNGNRYTTTSGGTSGSTAPTHTSGSASDGGVTWAFADHGYDSIVADTDINVLDEFLLTMGLVWRFLEAKGLDFTSKLAEYNAEVDQAVARDGGARPLFIGGTPMRRLIGWSSFPDTGIGQ